MKNGKIFDKVRLHSFFSRRISESYTLHSVQKDEISVNIFFSVPNKKKRAPRIFALKNGNTKLTRFGYTEFAQTDSTQAKVGKINIV